MHACPLKYSSVRRSQETVEDIEMEDYTQIL